MVESNNILVVDDDAVICSLLDEILTEHGYAVNTVMCGRDALAELVTRQYQLVMLDLVLPDMLGTAVLAEMRTAHPDTDAIMMTSSASMENAIEALRLGAQDYLLKPFENLEIVVRAVDKALERRLIVNENARLNQDLLAKNRTLEHAVQRLTMLNEFATALHSGFDLKQLLQLLVNAIAQELDADRASLMLINQDLAELSIEAFIGIDEQLAKSIKVRIGEGVAGWVAKHGEMVFSENIHQDSRFLQNPDRPYRSDSFISAPLFLCVPIKMQHSVIGVININNKKGGGVFTEEDSQLVTTLAGQVAVAIENARNFDKLRQSSMELKEAHFQTIGILSEAIEVKDAVTGGHSERMLCFATAVAKSLKLTEQEIELLNYAALLHDIGKIGISQQILNKPAQLTPEEFAHVKEHPRIGAKMIRDVKFLAPVAPLILAHHEKFDGTGYPHGIAGEHIPIQSRIVAVLDAYDAMTSERPYRAAPGHEWAVQELRKFSGSQFDPLVVEALLTTIEQEKNGADKQGEAAHG